VLDVRLKACIHLPFAKIDPDPIPGSEILSTLTPFFVFGTCVLADKS
jgi:hypothetical protein